jgi:hypothetical protein
MSLSLWTPFVKKKNLKAEKQARKLRLEKGNVNISKDAKEAQSVH